MDNFMESLVERIREREAAERREEAGKASESGSQEADSQKDGSQEGTEAGEEGREREGKEKGKGEREGRGEAAEGREEYRGNIRFDRKPEGEEDLTDETGYAPGLQVDRKGNGEYNHFFGLDETTMRRIVAEELSKQIVAADTEGLLKSFQTGADANRDRIIDSVHAENVKCYRNTQTSLGETEGRLIQKLNEQPRMNVFIIAILILTVLNFVISILLILHFFTGVI